MSQDSAIDKLQLPADEMTRLMVAAGYDTSKTHPHCYDRFSYVALFQLLADRALPSSDATSDTQLPRSLVGIDGAANFKQLSQDERGAVTVAIADDSVHTFSNFGSFAYWLMTTPLFGHSARSDIERDAARYRWLRSHDKYEYPAMLGFAQVLLFQPTDELMTDQYKRLSGEALDAAIDVMLSQYVEQNS